MEPGTAFACMNKQPVNGKNGRNLPLLEVHPVEYVRKHVCLHHGPVQLQQPAAIWIESGKGIITIDIEDYEIRDNMLVCLSQGQLMSIASQDEIKGCFMSFSPEFLMMAEGHTKDSLLDSLYHAEVSPIVLVNAAMQAEISEVVQMVHREYSTNGMMRLPIVKGLLKLFLAYLAGVVRTAVPESQNERDIAMGRKFLELVKKHFLTRKSVAEYADELCVTPNYLNRVVKKNSGYTASYHIQQHIIMEAKRQAMHSGLSMKEVAYLLGFNDYAHFSKFFKNNSGMNFTSFKNQVRNIAYGMD